MGTAPSHLQALPPIQECLSATGNNHWDKKNWQIHRERWDDRKKDTNSVVGAQWVESVCSTHKQTTMMAEKNLDEITALSLLEKKRQKKKIWEEW